MRFLQHKEEAYWFYRYLSIVYDSMVNPWFHTPKMRDDGLKLVCLDRPDLDVVDVGAGTGFATLGIVKHVDPNHVHHLDQSDFQQAKAKKKPELNGVHFKIGDAEALPYATDQFDRYVSSGSIEYWPDPQRAVAESYRVIKEGGLAVNLGPVQPKNFLGKLVANIFMLFPTVDEYLLWYKEAGFVDVRYIILRPDWVKKEDYGIAIVGRKPKAGESPWKAPTAAPEESLNEKTSSRSNPLLFLFRFAIGSLAGAIFMPVAYIKTAIDKCCSQAPSKESSP
jgi:MPBQ/MSBQ methyltransferase